MKPSDRFWDRIANKYSRSPVPDDAIYQHKLAVTRRYLDPQSDVLEIGCGTGTTAIYHAPFVRRIRATDISRNMIDIARDKAELAKVDNVSFEVSSAEDLEVDDNSVDVVLALSLLHLVDDRQTVIDDVYRMLKPGGVFVTSTACIGDKLAFFKYIGPVGRRLGFMPLVRVFTTDELRESMLAAGFAIEYDYKPEKSHALFLVARKAD